MNVVLMILQGLELVSAEVLPVEELVARLKTIFTLNPNAQVSVQNLASDALQADAGTLQLVADWQTAHGLPVTVSPSSSASSSGAASPAAPGASAPTAPAAPADKSST